MFKNRERLNFKKYSAIKNKFGWFTLAAAFFFLLWLIFGSAVFTVKKFEISGNDRILSAEIESKAWDQASQSGMVFGSQRNLLLFDSSELEARLGRDYVLDDLAISKRPLHTVKITVKEKRIDLIWHEGAEYYLINHDGTIILSETSPAPGAQLPLIENQGEWAARGGKIDNQSDKIGFVLKLADKLNGQNLVTKPDKYQLFTSGDPSIKLIASGTPTIEFSSNDDPEKQLNRLLALVKNVLKDGFKKKTYINLKFGDKIFYQ